MQLNEKNIRFEFNSQWIAHSFILVSLIQLKFNIKFAAKWISALCKRAYYKFFAINSFLDSQLIWFLFKII